MNGLSLTFDRPAYLLLLALVPIVVWIGWRSLSGLGGARQAVAIAARSFVLLLLVLAVADVQIVRITERIAAFFLLDQSFSLTRAQRDASLDYVASSVAAHRNASREDLAGVIVFGKEPSIEQPLFPSSGISRQVASLVEGESTDLGAALRLAKASMPDAVGRRVVVVSDGNENRGDALAEARTLVEAGIGIDVAPLPRISLADVRVAKIGLPSRVRAGVPFDVAVVLEHQPPQGARPAREVRGRIVVTRQVGRAEQLVADQAVSLPAGKQVLRFREELDQAAFYTYEAKFIPDGDVADRFTQNNAATAFTHLQGRGQVLFVVNAASPHEFDDLVALLRANDMEVTVQPTDALFTSLGELQQYDTVVLANVPRTSTTSEAGRADFTDEQIAMLTRNVEQFGCGLVMLGGPESFGAGDWANTELEKAMPVDFQIRNAKVAAVTSLMLVIDKSGSMDGEKLRLSKAAAQAAVEELGLLDEIGVIAFDSAAQEVVRLRRVGDQRHRIKTAIGRIASGGGTNLEPGIRLGYERLRASNASVRHMIVLTDGQTAGAGYVELAARMREQHITTTAIAVGTDAARGLLQDVAVRGGGKYYQVTNPRALPKIFMKETRRVVRPLVFEDLKGFIPQVVQSHEILSGVGDDLPPLTGFVLTTLKDSPLVEAPILAPKPGKKNDTILATWTYGLGHTAVLTTDAGERWAKAWPEWSGYDKLYVQLIRWSMRPLGDQGDFTVATEVKEGWLRTVVTGLAEDGTFLNGLPMQGVLTTSDGAGGQTLPFRQVAPGRYVAEIPVEETGSYLAAIKPGTGYGLLRAGVTVGYSPEFSDEPANESLLLEMSTMVPPGGEHGEIIRLPENPRDWRRFHGPDVFRGGVPKGRSLTPVWPSVVLVVAVVFLADILLRRVRLSLADVRTAYHGLVGTRPAESDADHDRIARLKSIKASTTATGTERYQASEYSSESESDDRHHSIKRGDALASGHSDASIPKQNAVEAETYSERLLRVKRQLRDQGSKPGS